MSRPAEALDGDRAHAQNTPSQRALQEAAEWHIRFAEKPLPEAERRAFQRWLRSDADHPTAWNELKSTWDSLERARRPAARAALECTLEEEQRQARRLLRKGASSLLLLLLLLPAIWLALGIESPRHLLADHHTAIGEIRSIELPDGSRLVLGTASAVDVQFDAEQRRLRLHAGRLFVDVAPDPDRPLEVVTGEARVRALGTGFSVQQLPKATRVTVFESTVEVCPATGDAECRQLHDGQQAEASRQGVGPVRAVTTGPEPAWTRGYLELDNRPVADVLAELARHHRGVLRYDAAALTGLKVSGVLPLDDSTRALDALAAGTPIRVERFTPWLISVSRTDQ